MSDPCHLFLSADFLAAVNTCGRTRIGLAAAVAPALGYSSSTVRQLFTPGFRIPVNAGRNTIVDALCRELGFPVERALSPTCTQRPKTPPKIARERAASIEAQFETARHVVRAQRRRLSDEDAQSRRPRD